MTSATDDWERRVAELWDAFDDLPEEELLARMEALAGERRDDDPVAAFERGSAYYAREL